MEAALPAPATDKKAIFGTTSLVFALLTVVLPVVVLIYFGLKAGDAMQPPDDPNRAKDIGEAGRGVLPFAIAAAGVAFAIIASGVSSLVGTLTGVVALIRRERSVWRPIIGLIVNVPVTLFVLFLIIVAQANH
jgi:hypothetical protein